jgi:N-acetylmuramoyl-L-alanine amidase
LAAHGFEVPRHGDLDEPTRRVLSAFQMKYRPSKFDGVPDAETAAMLDVLTSRSAATVPPVETKMESK